MEKISLAEIKLMGLSLGRKTTNENGQSAIDCGSHLQKFEAGKYAERIPNKASLVEILIFLKAFTQECNLCIRSKLADRISINQRADT